MIRSVAPEGRPDLGGAFQPIIRPRLIDRLATAAAYRIAIVIAPAGFGKSVAIRQYLSTLDSWVIYDVPPNATRLIPFVRAFADALRALAPGFRKSLSTALDGIRDSASPGEDLGDWAAAHLRSLRHLIVIDDLHIADHDLEVAHFLVRVVNATQNGPRWLLSSRNTSHLPVASWLAYGDCDLAIDALDLRFTLTEAMEGARTTRLAVREDELRTIVDLTDGWPAALTLALKTSTRASDLKSLAAGTREVTYQYLAEQVWRSLDDRFRGFLRTIAFLPLLEPRLAVASGYDDASALIDQLLERVAFVSVLEPGVYKLHDLFRDFVQRQVARDGDCAMREARITAGRTLEVAGLMGPALERYLEARARPEIEALLVQANLDLLEAGDIDAIDRALKFVPLDRVQTSPELLAIRAAVDETQGRVEQADKWYAAAIKRATNLAFRVKVIIRYGIFLQQRGRLDAVEMLESLLDDDLDVSQRAHILGLLAATYATGGRYQEARSLIAEALAVADFEDDELRARTYSRAAVVAFYGSDEYALERFATEGARIATEIGAYSLAARLCSSLYSMHAAASRVPEAIWYATQVIAHGERAGDPYARALGTRVLYQLEAERGNAPRVAEIEQELAAIKYRGPVASYCMVFGQVLALCWLKKFAAARAAILAVDEIYLEPYQRRACTALLAVVTAAAGDCAAATDVLAKYEQTVLLDDDPRPLFDRRRGFADRLAILATLLVGRHAAGLRKLRSARYHRPDLDAFDSAINALRHQSEAEFDTACRELQRAGAGGFIPLIELVRPCLQGTAVKNSGLIKGLTSSELEVLRAMALGLSNQSIADQQRRTINTVRTHVSSILRKLGAQNRSEAIAIGQRNHLTQL